MKKNPNSLWIAAIVLGWLFDFLFWKQSFGINFAIFAGICLIGGFLLLWINHQRPARGTLWLIPLILFFAAITFIRAEPMTLFLGILFTLFLMGLLATTFIGGRWFEYNLADYGYGFMKLIGSMIARPILFYAEVKREQAESGIPAKRINLWPIIRGIVIAIPIVAIFAALLASADTIFGNQLNAFLKLFFNLDTFPEYIFRLCYILFIAYILAGVFLHAASQSKDEKLIGKDKPLISQFLGFTETVIVLGSVIVLFTAFVIVQFKYFFGGQANIQVGGLTYSEYARRGFGELVAVALLSLLMILGLSSITRRENEAQKRAYSGLSIALVALVIVILVSAYQRLNLYEIAYGYSRLRTYTHIALICTGLLMFTVVMLEILRRERFIAFAILAASLVFAISLGVLNVDGFIVRQNVNRATRRNNLDVPYLVSLSSDSVPVLVDEFLSPSLPTSIHEAIGAVLLCRGAQSDSTQAVADWRSFTFSRWAPDRAMEKVSHQLVNGYHLNFSILQIRTPGNVEYDCR